MTDEKVCSDQALSPFERRQGKALPYTADLHVSESSPLERAIWHTHQNVKAFSPAVLFIIPIRAQDIQRYNIFCNQKKKYSTI